MSLKNKRANADPFEQAFFDYQLGDDEASLIIRSNKGDPETVPVHYFFRNYSEMPELEKKALALCSGKVLDIGAGAGSHSLYLQQHGFDVTALDIRPGFVSIMKYRGIKKVVLADIMKYRIARYDTLLLLMNGIGLASTTEGIERFLVNTRDLLKPGGQIILDSTDLLYFYQQEDGTTKIDLRENYYGEVEYRMEYNGLTGKPFTWLYLDFSTLSEYSDNAGLQCELIMETEMFNYLARLYV